MPPYLLLCCLLLLWPLQSNSQTLEFLVQKTCNKIEQTKKIMSRNPYSIAGCNMTMVCRYSSRQHCKGSNNTLLAVKRCQGNKCEEDVSNVVIRESSRTKCNVSVDFINATTEMDGKYRCMELNFNQSLPNYFRDRNIRIGYLPKIYPDKDVHIVYHPMKQIDIVINTKNYSQVFPDDITHWNVFASFSEDIMLTCDPWLSDTRCERRREPGEECTPCIITLNNYAGFGQYNHIGNIGFELEIKIQVTNIFGEAHFSTSVFPLEWVKPDKVETDVLTDASSAYAFIRLPQSMDKYHICAVSKRLQEQKESPLKLFYNLNVLSLEKQALIDPKSKDFFKRYGFIRNLADDQKAFENVGNLSSNEVSQLCWNQTTACNDATSSNCTIKIQLPLPSLYCKLDVVLASRYASEPESKTFLAGEAAPLKGLLANETRAICQMQDYDDECTMCLVYFKEIPLPWRGGVIRNYSLTVKPASGSRFCKKDRTQTVLTSEDSNTFVVSDLMAGGTYNSSLVGHNAMGESPDSAKTIYVPTKSSSLAAPRLLVVERNDNQYRLTWADGEKKKNGTYFVHSCYASRLGTAVDVFGYHTAEQFNRCMTNMVTKQVPTDSENIGTFENITRYYIDLRPIFFVSMVAQDDWSSGLVGVDCYFTKGKSPKNPQQLKIEKPDEDPRSLIISFSLPCGSSLEYQYGRPDRYYLQITKMGVDMETEHAADKCRDLCKRRSAGKSVSPVRLENDINFKKDIVRQISNLDVSTTYCVGISLGEIWTCQIAKTRSENSGKTVMLVLAVSIPLLLALAVGTLILKVLCMLKKRYRKLASKFCKLDLTAMLQPTHELEMAKGKHLTVEAVPTLFNCEMEVQIPRDNRICDVRDLVEALLLESSNSSVSLLTTGTTDLSLSTSAHTEDECTDEHQSNRHVLFSRYSSQQSHPEAHTEKQQEPHSSQPCQEKEEENESSSLSEEEETDEKEVEERSLSRYQSQESHREKQEGEPRQFTRYSSQQPQQDEAVEEREEEEEEKEEIKEGEQGKEEEEPEEQMPFGRYASQLCGPHPQDRQGTVALLSTALDESTMHTDDPNQLCGEFTLPLFVELICELSQLGIHTGKSSSGQFGTQLVTNKNSSSQDLPLQRNIGDTDADLDDILTAAAGHHTAFLFPKVKGEINAHGRSGLASLKSGDDKTHEQSAVHLRDHDTDTLSVSPETQALSTNKGESHVFEIHSMLDVRDTRNKNEGVSEIAIEDILQAATSEDQPLLTHNVRGTQPSTQLPKDNRFVLNKQGILGNNVLFVERDSSGNVDLRRNLSQNNYQTCSPKLLNTSHNENEVNVIALAAEGQKPCTGSFNCPPTTKRYLEESEMNNSLNRTESVWQSTDKTKTSSKAPLTQATLETNILKQYDTAEELSARISELKYCDENIPECTETTKPGVFMSVQYADLFKTVLQNDLDGSLENILIAAEASNLPKTDLLCAQIDWPTSRQSSRIDSCSEQDSQYCTSGVECESGCESAQESSDSSSEGSTSDLSAFLKSKPLRKPTNMRNKVPNLS